MSRTCAIPSADDPGEIAKLNRMEYSGLIVSLAQLQFREVTSSAYIYLRGVQKWSQSIITVLQILLWDDSLHDNSGSTAGGDVIDVKWQVHFSIRSSIILRSILLVCDTFEHRTEGVASNLCWGEAVGCRRPLQGINIDPAFNPAI